MVDALTLAVEEANAAGGLLGRQIKLINYDTQSNMQLYTQFAQQAALKDKVAVVHGGITSASREVIRPVLDRFKTLYFYNTQYEGGVCDRNQFDTGVTPAQTVEKLVPYAMKKWGKKVYVIATFCAEQRPGAAIVWYERAATLEPFNTEAPERIASVDVELGRTDEAIAAYTRGIAAHSDDVDLRNEFGLLLAARHEYDESASQFHAALKTDPNFVPAHVNLASVLVEQGNLTEAAEHLQEAVRLDPENFDAFHNAGVVLAQLRDYDSAIRMLAVAAQLKPDSPEARNDLGVALSNAGRYKHAAYEFEQAIALRPTYTAARQNLAITEQLRRRRRSHGRSGLGSRRTPIDD